jgi:tRNA G37 N-methylase Trm5
MRHLRVPKRQTQAILECINNFEWAPEWSRVLNDGDFRLLYLGDNAPAQLPDILGSFEEVEADQPPRLPQRWIEHLPDYLDESIITLHQGIWPNAQEPLGEILVFKIERGIEQYSQAVALAKISHHKTVRAVFRDHGVTGEFRIRDLEPLAARLNEQIIDKAGIESLDVEIKEVLLATNTIVREFGVSIQIDPQLAFFSHRLQGERVRNVEGALKLKEMLGRPLNIADPYCGVGPAFAHLLQVDGLVGNLLASDLNADAMPLLADNLSHNGIKVEVGKIDGLTALDDGNFVGIQDALELKNDERLIGQFDMLLINLPHDTMKHLPHLLGLLKRNSPTLVRGWLVTPEDDIPMLQNELQNILAPTLEGQQKVEIVQRRQYSSSDWLCRFEAWLNILTE